MSDDGKKTGSTPTGQPATHIIKASDDENENWLRTVRKAREERETPPLGDKPRRK